VIPDQQVKAARNPADRGCPKDQLSAAHAARVESLHRADRLLGIEQHGRFAASTIHASTTESEPGSAPCLHPVEPQPCPVVLAFDPSVMRDDR
jgi:hypothetical protein